jgi:hypothetical protein
LSTSTSASSAESAAIEYTANTIKMKKCGNQRPPEVLFKAALVSYEEPETP